MAKTLMLLAVAFIASACSESVEYDRHAKSFPRLVYVSDQTPQEEIESVQLSVDSWNSKTGQATFELRIASDMEATGCNIRVEIMDDVPTPPERAKLGYMRAGVFLTSAEHCHGRVLVRRDRLETTTLEHEFGHVIGLGHTEDESDLMFSLRIDGQSLKDYVINHVLGMMGSDQIGAQAQALLLPVLGEKHSEEVCVD
jgi:hypothetical protein